MYTHVHTHTHVHTRTNRYTHVQTGTHTYIHVHTCWSPLACQVVKSFVSCAVLADCFDHVYGPVATPRYYIPCRPRELATKSFQRHLPPLVDLERHSYFAEPLLLVCRSLSNQSFHAQRWLTASMTVYRHRPLAHRAIKSFVSCSVGRSLRLRIRTPICTSFLHLP